MQVYELFFQVLRKQKGQIIMYLVIFLSVTLAAASQGEKTGESTFSPTTYKFAVMDADNSEISRALIAYLEQGNEKVHIEDKKEVIQDEIYNRSISCVLRIPSGFFESYLSGSTNKKMEVIISCSISLNTPLSRPVWSMERISSSETSSSRFSVLSPRSLNIPLVDADNRAINGAMILDMI